MIRRTCLAQNVVAYPTVIAKCMLLYVFVCLYVCVCVFGLFCVRYPSGCCDRDSNVSPIMLAHTLSARTWRSWASSVAASLATALSHDRLK